MIKFNLKSAHRMVREQQALGNDVRWDNYDIIFFRGDTANPGATAHAITSPAGAFRKGIWGFENRVSVGTDGLWHVDVRNLKRRK